jgi:hypothetical protein
MKIGHHTVLGLSVLALAACGGGGSSPASTPANTGISMGGVVATGNSVSGAAIAATCANGSGTATSSADGSYTLTIASGSLPCVLQATSGDGKTVLHSVATGNAGDASDTANITSLTELLVANLTGQQPSSYFSSVAAASLATTITPSAISAAQTAVASVLKAGGVDTSAAGDFVTGALVAGTSGASGNGYDAILDGLGTRLAAAGTTLTALANSLASTPAPGSVVVPVVPPVVSPSAAMLLQPPAATCSALRSGQYRFVTPNTSGNLANEFDLKAIDAVALTILNGDGSVSKLTPNGTCRFTTDGGWDVVVSQAGVLVGRSNIGTLANPVYGLAIGFPEQTHAVAEFAGTWNNISMQAANFGGANTAYTGSTATATFSTAGVASNVTFCQNATTWGVAGADCTSPANPDAGLTPAPGGGFYSGASCPTVNDCGRAFAYQAGNGDLMIVGVDGDGSFSISTKQRAYPLPAVGTTNSAWDIYLGADLVSPTVIDQVQHTVSSVDTAAGSWTRTQQTIGQNNAHTESLFADNPRQGYIIRVGGTATTPTGATVTVQPFTNLSMRGMGLSALILPDKKWLAISMVQP